jgi:hypothetical protein
MFLLLGKVQLDADGANMLLLLSREVRFCSRCCKRISMAGPDSCCDIIGEYGYDEAVETGESSEAAQTNPCSSRC